VISALAIKFALGDSFFNVKTLSADPSDINLAKFKNASFGLLLSSGLVAVATGGFGCLFTCCKQRWFAVLYGIFLSFTWIFIFILGCVVTGASVSSQGTLQAFCDGTLSNSATANAVSATVDKMEYAINSYINANMCSQACPCNAQFRGGWNNFTEASLNATVPQMSGILTLIAKEEFGCSGLHQALVYSTASPHAPQPYRIH
jgi:hypothetical protein